MNRGRGGRGRGGRGRSMGGGGGGGGGPTTKLHVTNLPEYCKNEDLESLFENFGTVTEVAIIRDFAFVHFSDSEAASRAINGLDGYMLNGSSIAVKFSTSGGKGSGGERNNRMGGFSSFSHGGDEDINPTKLHVRKLPDGVTANELESLFESCGKIAECDIVRDYAFVHFVNASDANKAVREFNGYNWNGSELVVKHSTSSLRQKPGAGAGDCFKCGGRGHNSNNCPSDKRRGFQPRPSPYARPFGGGGPMGMGGGRGPDRGQKQLNPTKLHVTNIPDGCSKGELEKLFEQYGKVAETAIIRDFAFVHFVHAEDAKKAVKNLNGHNWRGVTLSVCHSTSSIRQKPGAGPGTCYKCGGRGHTSNECPPAFGEMEPDGYSDRFPPPPYADPYRQDPYMDPYERIDRDPFYRRALLERLLRETDDYCDPYARPPPEFYERQRGGMGARGPLPGQEPHGRMGGMSGNGYTSFADTEEQRFDRLPLPGDNMDPGFMRPMARDPLNAGFFA